MAVVIDFGNRVTYSKCPNLNIRDIIKIVVRLVNTPETMPIMMAVKFFFKSLYCSYKGIARHIVAGVRRKLKYFALLLYSAYSMPDTSNIIMVKAMATNNGLNINSFRRLFAIMPTP